MATVRDQLLGSSTTAAERKLLAEWLTDAPAEHCARQRAWEEVHERLGRGTLQFNW